MEVCGCALLTHSVAWDQNVSLSFQMLIMVNLLLSLTAPVSTAHSKNDMVFCGVLIAKVMANAEGKKLSHTQCKECDATGCAPESNVRRSIQHRDMR